MMETAQNAIKVIDCLKTSIKRGYDWRRSVVSVVSALEVVRLALEKQVTKKPIPGINETGCEQWVCPVCDRIVISADDEEFLSNYYPDYGQKLDLKVEI